MSSNFDWQTEDDRPGSEADWDLPESRPARPPRYRPRWRLLGLLAVLVLAAAALVWWRIDRRMDATLQAMRHDVASSFNLVQQAAADKDEELFRSVLSGRDPGWTATQLTLFADDLVLDRGRIGLKAAEGSIPSSLPTADGEVAAGESAASIEFSPDLNEAIVVHAQPYISARRQPVVLRQTSVYRRGDHRWLLAPPLPAFWGDTETADTPRLVVSYPARDRDIALRLADDLSDHVDRLCETLPDVDCSDSPIAIRFDTNPAALSDFARPLGLVPLADEPDRDLRLPTPTLVGLPVQNDEAQAENGYEALLEAYASQLIGAVIADSVGWACCDQAFLFRILTERQLSDLGLQGWPVTTAQRQRVLDERLRLTDLATLWWETDTMGVPLEREWAAYVAVDFLLHALPVTSPASLQQAMARSGNLEEWFGQAFAAVSQESSSWIASSLEQAWWMYAMQGSLEAAGEPPIPGDADLMMACTTVETTNRPEPSRLLRYAAPGWEELYALDGFVWMSPLPAPGTLLMQEFVLASETWQTNLWREGLHEFAYQDGDVYSISFGQTDPAGKQLVTYSFDPENGATATHALDLTTCDGGCAVSTLPGNPVWSPSGEQALYVGEGEASSFTTLLTNGRIVIVDGSPLFRPQFLRLGPGRGATVDDLTDAGFGYSPFWIDDDTFGFIRSVNSGFLGPHRDQVLVLQSESEESPQALLETVELEQYLPEQVGPRHIILGYVLPHPSDRDLLFVVALDTFGKEAFVFSYDLRTRLPELRLQAGYELNHSLGFSPDGRYLVLTGNWPSTLPGDNTGLLLLHDIAANETMPFATRLPFFISSVSYDWSNDSGSLALALDDGLLGIIKPNQRRAYPLPHPYGTCTSLAWTER